MEQKTSCQKRTTSYVRFLFLTGQFVISWLARADLEARRETLWVRGPQVRNQLARPNVASLWYIGQAIIFLPCGSFLLSFFLFSSPNLSGCRVDVYHTHGVTLVRIQNAGLKCAARGSLKIQDAKNPHFGPIAQFCRAVSSELRHVSTIGKKTLNSNTSSTCPDNMVNFGLLTAEIEFGAPLQISTGFAPWKRYCTALQQRASDKLCDLEQRTPPIFGRVDITLGIGPHCSES